MNKAPARPFPPAYASRSAYQARNYATRRAALVTLLGGKCAYCGTTHKLELDAIHGHIQQPRTLNRWTRVRMYEADRRNGNLRVLCRRCNASRGALRLLGPDNPLALPEGQPCPV